MADVAKAGDAVSDQFNLVVPSIRPEALDKLFLQEAMSIAPKFTLLTHKEPNHVWAEKMRIHWLNSGAEWCVTLQDDVILYPRFWEALSAMVQHVPAGAVLGLAAVHPGQVEAYYQGHRWYRTRAWCVGWGIAMRRAEVQAFDLWCRRSDPQRVKSTTEDTLLNHWITETGRDAWHPSVSTVDHDVRLESTYANDDHVHRRPRVTWRDTPADLTREEYWIDSSPRLYEVPVELLCWVCGAAPAAVALPGRWSVCRPCLASVTAHVINPPQMQATK